MIAINGTLGEESFNYFHGPHYQCQQWIREQKEIKNPRIISDREFASWKYPDGSHVWRENNL